MMQQCKQAREAAAGAGWSGDKVAGQAGRVNVDEDGVGRATQRAQMQSGKAGSSSNNRGGRQGKCAWLRKREEG
jgi:hypothetical protein